jgi:monothiol glutaredoxin
MTDNEHTQNQIKKIIEAHSIVLFMKGNRDFPQCGFSAKVCHILDECVESYETFDVLSSAEIRSGIKKFSDWPTIPQLYIEKEFIGGCDIVSELFLSGELEKMLKGSAGE